MIKVTSRHMECTHFNLDNSRMPAVALKDVEAEAVLFLRKQKRENSSAST